MWGHLQIGATSKAVEKINSCAILCANARRAAALRAIVDPVRVRVYGLYEPKLGAGPWDAVFVFRDEFGASDDDPVPVGWKDWAAEMCLGLRAGVRFGVTYL